MGYRHENSGSGSRPVLSKSLQHRGHRTTCVVGGFRTLVPWRLRGQLGSWCSRRRHMCGPMLIHCLLQRSAVRLGWGPLGQVVRPTYPSETMGRLLLLLMCSDFSKYEYHVQRGWFCDYQVGRSDNVLLLLCWSMFVGQQRSGCPSWWFCAPSLWSWRTWWGGHMPWWDHRMSRLS